MSANNKTRWQIAESEAGLRLDKWLAADVRLGSRARALAALEKGQIFVNDSEQTPAEAGRRLQVGEAVRLWLDRPGSAQRRNYAGSGKRIAGLQIVYEDQTLLVVNKPAGLLSVPLPAQPEADSLLDRVTEHLARHQERHKALIVHRLDRDTSGLVVFAKSAAMQKRLKDQFERREPERVYWAFVHGQLAPAAGMWRDELVWDEKQTKQRAARDGELETHEAVCRYRTVEAFAQASLLEVTLVTGKRNQIRIQAGLRGHPLVGERQYVYANAPEEKLEFTRQALHAVRLGFQHPADGRKLSFEAPLPEDLQALREQLKATRRRAPAPLPAKTALEKPAGKPAGGQAARGNPLTGKARTNVPATQAPAQRPALANRNPANRNPKDRRPAAAAAPSDAKPNPKTSFQQPGRPKAGFQKTGLPANNARPKAKPGGKPSAFKKFSKRGGA